MVCGSSPLATAVSRFMDKREDKDGRRCYVFHSYCCADFNSGQMDKCRDLYGYTWAVMSRGPEGKQGFGIQGVLAAGGVSYDSTNGTMSVGAIIRTNKGVTRVIEDSRPNLM